MEAREVRIGQILHPTRLFPTKRQESSMNQTPGRRRRQDPFPANQRLHPRNLHLQMALPTDPSSILAHQRKAPRQHHGTDEILDGLLLDGGQERQLPGVMITTPIPGADDHRHRRT